MAFTIAVTGKGGVGKTTISTFVIQWLVAKGIVPVLAVDADSNANLNEALGVEFAATVGGIREDARNKVAELSGIGKQEYLDICVQNALVEESGYDLVVMGRPEGPGCYCYANNVLRDVLKKVAENYKAVVIDSEAGMEHISRRTVLSIDCLFIVSDCTVRGVNTAKRINELATEMGTPVSFRGLIVNRVPGGVLPDGVRAAVEASGLDLLGVLPMDQEIADTDGSGEPIARVSGGSAARTTMDSILERVAGGSFGI